MSVRKEILVKYNVINDVFNYKDLDIENDKLQTYLYFENTFMDLYESYANIFNIRDYCFYINNAINCNAFATKRKGYNIIGITNGYPILLSRKMDKEHFVSIVLAGIHNKEPTREAYIELYQDKNFDISKFFIDCSINFTFRHEFQHIIQFNYYKSLNNSLFLHENLEEINYDIRRHVWEYDADRSASFNVLKHVFHVHSKFDVKSDEKLKCLMYIGCSSILVTKMLHCFGLMDQFDPPTSIKKIDFYIRENSHPHPLVRCINIIGYFFDCISSDFSKMNIDYQEFFNNIFIVANLYFKSIFPSLDIIKEVFKDLGKHIDTLNTYNIELYDRAIQDEAIRDYLLSQNIEFDEVNPNNAFI